MLRKQECIVLIFLIIAALIGSFTVVVSRQSDKEVNTNCVYEGINAVCDRLIIIPYENTRGEIQGLTEISSSVKALGGVIVNHEDTERNNWIHADFSGTDLQRIKSELLLTANVKNVSYFVPAEFL